jgi:hypothetical protein
MFGLGGILPFIVLLGTMGGGFYWYYIDTQERIGTLRENNAVLESANRTNQETITQLENNAVLQRRLNEELVSKFNEASNKVDVLRDKLIDHDLTNLSLKKPGLIEKRINAGTQKVFDNLESITAIRVQSTDTGTSGGDGNEDSQKPN